MDKNDTGENIIVQLAVLIFPVDSSVHSFLWFLKG